MEFKQLKIEFKDMHPHISDIEETLSLGEMQEIRERYGITDGQHTNLTCNLTRIIKILENKLEEKGEVFVEKKVWGSGKKVWGSGHDENEIKEK